MNVRFNQFLRALYGIAILLTLTSCRSGISQQQAEFPTSTGPLRTDPNLSELFRVEVIATGLDVPWDIEPMPDGRIFVLERPGRVRLIQNGKLDPQPYAAPEDVVARGQGGLLDMTPHPNYANNRWIYLAYSAETEGKMHTRITRFRDTGSGLVEPKVIFNADPVEGERHFGCRIQFGQDGKLYFVLGERGKPDKAQDLSNVNGKTLRINEDGSIPTDNPFVNQPEARPEIFSYGNRNIQAMDFHPETGLLFVAEHGPTGYDRPGGGDEINLIEAGKNYGWPVIHHDLQHPEMESPLVQFTPATAAGGAAFYSGNLFPAWKGSLFVANLRSQNLQRIVIKDRQVVEVETLLTEEYGRLRAVAEDSAGYLYVSTSNWDGIGQIGEPGEEKILRLVPVETQ